MNGQSSPVSVWCARLLSLAAGLVSLFGVSHAQLKGGEVRPMESALTTNGPPLGAADMRV